MKPSQEASTRRWDKAGASMKRATRRGSAGTPYLPRIGKVAHRYRYELEYLALVLTPPGQGLPGLRLLPAPSVFAAPGGTRQRGGAYRYSGLGSRYNGAPFSVRAATSLAALAGFVGGRKVQWPLCWVRALGLGTYRYRHQYLQHQTEKPKRYSLALLPLRLFVIPVLSTNVRPAMLPCCNAHVSMCMQRCAVEAQCCTERGPPPCQYSYLVAAAKVPVQHSTGPLLASQTGPADATERLVCQCTPLGIPQAGA
ncbi:hypothetical protein N5P37_010735 [Trichoderma harzianum]|nr:hypothetical protein N5P37_010735 [Trichoderma harzianum]